MEYKTWVTKGVKQSDGRENHGSWFKTWEDGSLLAWNDRNGDGKIQYASGKAFDDPKGKPHYDGDKRAPDGHRLTTNALPPKGQKPFDNEVYIDRDIIVLANPEIANLPNWVIALIAAGGLAAALSTAAGLLLVISSSISHDLLGKVLFNDPNTGQSKLSEKSELLAARLSAVAAILVAGYLGINPPGFVAQVVAFAFGLAAIILPYNYFGGYLIKE